MHKHDFCGSKVFTHARYWQIKKYVCIIFCGGGGAPGGHREFVGGERAPPPLPVATPLFLSHTSTLIIHRFDWLKGEVQ